MLRLVPLLALLAVLPVAAQTATVTGVDLLVDTAADDQTYDAAASLAACQDGLLDGDCTLREAIGVANANNALDRIGFEITDANGRDAATGVATIRPTSALPAITNASVVVDGYTQPGSAVNTLAVGTNAALRIEIDGTNAGTAASGITIGRSVTARGLVVNRFAQYGIQVVSSLNSPVVITGNYIGTNVAGTAVLANTLDGIYVSGQSPNVRIGTNGDGTADAAERNVIAGNRNGILISGTLTTGAVVAGNYVGLNAAGTAALGNRVQGIVLSTSVGARVGTNGDGAADAAERNVVAGSVSNGIALSANTTGAVVAGNYVGTDATGTVLLGNTRTGIAVINALGAGRIGTNADGVADAAEANLVAGNNTINIGGLGGITVDSNSSATILGNSVRDNTRLGIDLSPGGVSPNDVGDGDTGGNGLQNFPVLAAVARAPTGVAVPFTLNSTASTTFRVELFASAAADPTGYGEGDRFLGAVTVTTDASGNAAGRLASSTVADAEWVSATATPVVTASPPTFGGTSEFSLAVRLDPTAVAGLYNPSAAQGDGRGYRLLGPPVSGVTVTDLARLNLVQGIAAGADAAAFPAQYPLAVPNLFTVYTGNGYTRPATTAEVLAPGRGFFWQLYDRAITPDPAGFGGGTSESRDLTGFALVAAGTPLTANVSVAFADNVGAGTDNFQMLANPFARPLAVSGITVAGGTVQGGDVFQAFDPNGSTYRLLLTGSRLSVWQGVFAELNPATVGGAVTVTYSYASTDTNAPPTFYGRGSAAASAAPSVRFALAGHLADGTAVADEAAVVRLDAAGQAGYDALDAGKLTPPVAAFALVAPVAFRDGAPTRLAVDTRAEGAAASVPLALTATAGGTFTLAWTASLPDGWAATLHDAATGQTVDVAADSSYAFALDGPQDWATRFTLDLVPRGATAGEGGAGAVFALSAPRPNPTMGTAALTLTLDRPQHVRAVVLDALGREVAVLHDGEAAGVVALAVDGRTFAPGVYVVRVVGADATLVRRVTVAR